ncbi:MAG TPA: hypothetical protein VHS78_11920, partial [Candidatus Elarobacter sp.]|nr:hypothetical protein [Candidatus Elarobacter sp.]
DTSDYISQSHLVADWVDPIGVPVLDLYPAMRDYEASAYVKPLYANQDLHPSSYGRQFVAEHIAKKLADFHPWTSMRKP